eukprot:13692404-Ditylum_brightwellii.AAC.2
MGSSKCYGIMFNEEGFDEEFISNVDGELMSFLGTCPVSCILGVQDTGCRAGHYAGLTWYHPIRKLCVLEHLVHI